MSAARRTPGGDGAAAGDPASDDAATTARLREFVARFGAETVAVIEYLGRVGARIVLIAPSGEFGDALAPSVPAARQACERVGIAVREWDRELSAKLAPTPADRRRMAGQIP